MAVAGWSAAGPHAVKRTFLYMWTGQAEWGACVTICTWNECAMAKTLHNHDVLPARLHALLTYNEEHISIPSQPRAHPEALRPGLMDFESALRDTLRISFPPRLGRCETFMPALPRGAFVEAFLRPWLCRCSFFVSSNCASLVRKSPRSMSSGSIALDGFREAPFICGARV